MYRKSIHIYGSFAKSVVDVSIIAKKQLLGYLLEVNSTIVAKESETLLFENMVALQLFRIYGNDKQNNRIYFYIPENFTAIQACYSSTYERKVVKECRNRFIVTKEDEGLLKDKYGEIRIIPFAKWQKESYCLLAKGQRKRK